MSKTKTALGAFIIHFLAANLTIFTMDEPAMNPKINQASQKDIINADLYISPYNDQPVRYIGPSDQKKFGKIFKNNLTSLAEPYIYIDLKSDHFNDKKSLFIPATMLLNCNGNSIIYLEDADTIIKGVCKRNSTKKSFQEKLQKNLKKHYDKPEYYGKKKDIQLLLEADIVTSQEETRTISDLQGRIFGLLHTCIYTHGEYGCSNNKEFENIAFNNNNPAKKTKYQFFMDNQLGLRKKRDILLSNQPATAADQTAVYEFNKKNFEPINALNIDDESYKNNFTPILAFDVNDVHACQQRHELARNNNTALQQ